MDELRIDRHERGGWVVLAVVGSVDVATAPQLRQALMEEQFGAGRWLALDLDGVEFLDSFGLGVIVGAVKRAVTHDGEVVVVCARSRIIHLFEVTRLTEIIRVESTLGDLGRAGV